MDSEDISVVASVGLRNGLMGEYRVEVNVKKNVGTDFRRRWKEAESLILIE